MALDNPNLGVVLRFISISLTKEATDILRFTAIACNASQKGGSSEIEVECPLIVIERFIIMSINSHSFVY